MHKSGHTSLQNPTDRQTNRQTDLTGGALHLHTPAIWLANRQITVKTFRLKKRKEKEKLKAQWVDLNCNGTRSVIMWYNGVL